MKKRWSEKTAKLRPDHTWKAREGNRIFVADRGAVRFEFPQEWVMEPDSDSVKFYDLPPPDDNCRIAASYIRIPNRDWSGLPLSKLLQAATGGDSRGLRYAGEAVAHPRSDLEIAWQEFWFIDPVAHREAFTRFCIARGSGIQALITCEFWGEDRPRIDPVWQGVLDTLVLGKTIEDPTKGELYS